MSDGFVNPNFVTGLQIVRRSTPAIAQDGYHFGSIANEQVSLALDPAVFPSGLVAGQTYTIDVSVLSWTVGQLHIIPGPGPSSSWNTTFILGDATTGLSYTANGGETTLTLRGGGAGGCDAAVSSCRLT